MKYIIIYLLNLVDYVTTVYWTSLYGINTETNLLMRMALTEPWLFTMIKLVLFPLFLLYMYRKKHDDTAWMALGMFIVVVLMNLRVIFGW